MGNKLRKEKGDKYLQHTLQAHEKSVNCIAISPDGARILVSTLTTFTK